MLGIADCGAESGIAADTAAATATALVAASAADGVLVREIVGFD